MTPDAAPSQALIDAAQQYEADSKLIPIENRFLDDPTSKDNSEARAKFIADSLDKAATFGLDNGLITQDAAEMYRLEADTIRLGAIKPGDASWKFHSMLIDIGRQIGIIDADADFARRYQDPGNSLPPFDPGADRLKKAQDALATAQANKKLADDIRQLADTELSKDGGAPTSQPNSTVTSDAVSKITQAGDAALSHFKNFAGDESGSLPAQNLGDTVSNVLDSSNRVLSAIKDAALTDTPQAALSALNRASDFGLNLEARIGEALGDLPSAKIAGAIGILGDIIEFSAASDTAFAQFNQGDYAGALSTMSNAIGSISSGAISAYYGMAAAVLLGAPAAGVLAAGLVAGYLGSEAWGAFVGGNEQSWLFNLAEAFGTFDTPPPSPLVLDLDGDGVELTSVDGATAYFDVDVDGFAELTGWVAADDGLLALDVDGDGKIDDGSELFGDQTGYAHGFLALAAHDDNADGFIDANDLVYERLQVWQDLNSDGKSQADELSFLTELVVASSVSSSSMSISSSGRSPPRSG